MQEVATARADLAAAVDDCERRVNAAQWIGSIHLSDVPGGGGERACGKASKRFTTVDKSTPRRCIAQ